MGETKHINGVRSGFSLDSSIWIFITHVNLASFLISLANYQFMKEVCKKTSLCVWRFISFLESSFCKYTLRNRIVIFLSELFFLTLSNVSLSNHGLGWKCILSHIFRCSSSLFSSVFSQHILSFSDAYNLSV